VAFGLRISADIVPDVSERRQRHIIQMNPSLLIRRRQGGRRPAGENLGVAVAAGAGEKEEEAAGWIGLVWHEAAIVSSMGA